MKSTAGTIFITDTAGEAIYALAKRYSAPNEVYTAADANGEGLLKANTGFITRVGYRTG